jgi:hypothetical protein
MDKCNFLTSIDQDGSINVVDGKEAEGGKSFFPSNFPVFYIERNIKSFFFSSLPVSFRRNELKGKTIKGKRR